jgi:hypothetical protein
MAIPKSRSANAELQNGCREGGDNWSQDWSFNHPDIVLPDHAGPCCPGCGCGERVDHPH